MTSTRKFNRRAFSSEFGPRASEPAQAATSSHWLSRCTILISLSFIYSPPSLSNPLTTTIVCSELPSTSLGTQGFDSTGKIVNLAQKWASLVISWAHEDTFASASLQEATVPSGMLPPLTTHRNGRSCQEGNRNLTVASSAILSLGVPCHGLRKQRLATFRVVFLPLLSPSFNEDLVMIILFKMEPDKGCGGPKTISLQ